MTELDDIIAAAERDPETQEHGATVWYHLGLERYVYSCYNRLKCDAVWQISPKSKKAVSA